VAEPAVVVRGLGKKYRIDPVRRHESLREAVVRACSGLFRPAPAGEDLWALKEVTFEVPPGEVLGVIGRNGSGKSTLLKVLSQVTDPTEGQARVRGRVGSLLEVGAGFHHDLTGRENVYLNGAILGLSRREIRDRFDAIVSFAEVEEFIDTPVKRYSSGMQARLAFAVAAHLDTDVLLVDEVLAVGDAAFQKKCLFKMEETAARGRTVLLVSHQMGQIRRLCTRALWLDAGRVRDLGPVAQVTGGYELAQAESGSLRAEGEGYFRWWIQGRSDHLQEQDGRVTFGVALRLLRYIPSALHSIALYGADGQLVWATSVGGLRLEPGTHRFLHTLPSLPLRPGAYTWLASLHDGGLLVDHWNALPPLIIGTRPTNSLPDQRQGILNLPSEFAHEEEART
jgi:lipopolysaccharide transport system ATP-binding protein